ncbi:MAG: hypothetical protein KC492_39660 [Myxococcales bacterium]|nr:hypothetical protein [Myxococcales bacterium]
MPLKYMLDEPQIEEYRRLLGERPHDWEPSVEDAGTIALLQWQIREWSATRTRILTDDEIESVCNLVGLRPAPARKPR